MKYITCKECKRKDVKNCARGLCWRCYSRLYQSGELKPIEKPPTPGKFTDIQEQILIGLLLGDGCVFRLKETHNSYLRVQRKLEDKPYNEWLYENFKDFCNFGVKESSHYNKNTNKNYPNCSFKTRLLPIFNSYREKWYVNKIKIVPKGLILTPLIMAVWFCDDGSIYASNPNVPHRMGMELSTHGFSENEVKFLINLLCEKLHENFYLCKSKGKFFIKGADSATRAFIKEIDKFFPNGIDRKRYWDKPESRYYSNQPERSIVNNKNYNFNRISEKDYNLLNELLINNKSKIISTSLNRTQYSTSFNLRKFAKLGLVKLVKRTNWFLTTKGIEIIKNASNNNEMRKFKTAS